MLRETNGEWNGGNGRWCRACKQPIEQGQAATRLTFDQDPHGFDGLTGDYHTTCSRPYASIARALDALSRFPRG
ncbi:hypothetical protein PRN20_01110 [Devosia sp. ZB163]|uniref:hypothetical protein n=1 Tax=Devosia sp. ZB163 TaxID=3025938 RepID=UPI00235FC293|nr:hypothetical protein [Devosia sp. ZB163]MDC9822315.1 hypothetical protein [Devosia sp. ZB163]